MNTHRLENISFYKDNLEEEMKIIKIKGGFSCDEERAKEILELINSKSSIDVEDNLYSNLSSFGITCNMKSLERIKFLEEQEIENKKKKEQFEIDKVLAEIWYNSLNKEEQNYVRVLSQSKFLVTAQG
jgi:hypothetical protein